jgi:DNA-binding transcriptional regulator YdaS (Cro superfamily)
MRLADYLAKAKVSHASFADAVGVERSTVGRWAAGTLTPSPEHLTAIEHVTNSAVTRSDFPNLRRYGVPPLTRTWLRSRKRAEAR